MAARTTWCGPSSQPSRCRMCALCLVSCAAVCALLVAAGTAHLRTRGETKPDWLRPSRGPNPQLQQASLAAVSAAVGGDSCLCQDGAASCGVGSEHSHCAALARMAAHEIPSGYTPYADERAIITPKLAARLLVRYMFVCTVQDAKAMLNGMSRGFYDDVRAGGELIIALTPASDTALQDAAASAPADDLSAAAASLTRAATDAALDISILAPPAGVHSITYALTQLSSVKTTHHVATFITACSTYAHPPRVYAAARSLIHTALHPVGDHGDDSHMCVSAYEGYPLNGGVILTRDGVKALLGAGSVEPAAPSNVQPTAVNPYARVEDSFAHQLARANVVCSRVHSHSDGEASSLDENGVLHDAPPSAAGNSSERFRACRDIAAVMRRDEDDVVDATGASTRSRIRVSLAAGITASNLTSYNVGQLVSTPFLHTRRDWRECATVFPLTSRGAVSHLHLRYARFMITGQDDARSHALLRGLGDDVKAPTCRLAIGINSKASHSAERAAVRGTWLRTAAALAGTGDVCSPDAAVRVFFLLAEPKVAMAPHERTLLMDELRGAPGDIFWLPNARDCYHCVHEKVMTWFDWVQANTDCEYIVKMDDDVYLRILPLLSHLTARHASPPRLVYFGTLFGSFGPPTVAVRPKASADPSSPWYMKDVWPFDSFPPFMSGNMLGMSRDVMAHVAAAAKGEPDMRVEDAAIGIFISRLWEVNSEAGWGLPVSYDNEKGVFGGERVCTHLTAYDSANFAHGFNMYDRAEDDGDGRFCLRVDRSTMPEYDSVRDPAQLLRFDASARGRFHSVMAPWREAVAPRERLYLSVVGARIPGLAPAGEVPLWYHIPSAVHQLHCGTHVHGGEEVSRALTHAEFQQARYAGNRARGAHEQRSGCHATHVRGTWHENVWNGRTMVLTRCENSPAQLALSVFHPAGSFPASIPADTPRIAEHAQFVWMSPAHLVVAVPGACFTDDLHAFLKNIVRPLRDIHTGGRKRVIIVWAHCAAAAAARSPGEAGVQVDEAELAAKVNALVARYTHPQVKMEVIFLKETFTRAGTLNAAIAKAEDYELMVTLDMDMRTQTQFFEHARAFAQRGRSIYFPACFSRYNPVRVENYLAHAGVSAASAKWFMSTFTATPHTGTWISYGFGMVAAFVSDLRALGGFDSKQKTWGGEDNALYDAAKRSKLAVMHLIDSDLVHAYHHKSCGTLAGSSKHRACVDVRIQSEGSKLQLGLALTHMEFQVDGRVEPGEPAPAPAADGQGMNAPIATGEEERQGAAAEVVEDAADAQPQDAEVPRRAKAGVVRKHAGHVDVLALID